MVIIDHSIIIKIAAKAFFYKCSASGHHENPSHPRVSDEGTVFSTLGLEIRVATLRTELAHNSSFGRVRRELSGTVFRPVSN